MSSTTREDRDHRQQVRVARGALRGRRPRGRRRGRVVGGAELVRHGRGPDRRVHDRDRVDAVDEPAALRLDHLDREDPGARSSAGSSGGRGCSARPSLSRRRSPASGGSSARSPDRTARGGRLSGSRSGSRRSASPGLRAPRPRRVAALDGGREEAVEERVDRAAGRPARASGGCSTASWAGARFPAGSPFDGLLLGIRMAISEPGDHEDAGDGDPLQAAPDARRFGNPNHTIHGNKRYDRGSDDYASGRDVRRKVARRRGPSSASSSPVRRPRRRVTSIATSRSSRSPATGRSRASRAASTVPESAARSSSAAPT